MKAVIIFSGGMDSTTLLYDSVKKWGADEVLALSFIYGSKHNKREIAAAQKIAKKIKVEHRVINLDFNRWGFKSDLLTSGGDIPEGRFDDKIMKSTVVPFRNGIMLSIAAGVADSIDAKYLLYGAHTGDHAIYPDCTDEFANAMREAIYNGTDNHIILLALFNDDDKGKIVKKGIELGVPYELTWSCYKGGEKHCGKCGTCVERKEAFEQAGVPDPTEYEE